jgi:hypothetical protein
MVLRQAIAALLLIGRLFALFPVWFAFAVLLAGYDMAAHLAPLITASIGGLTEFGLGRWTIVTVLFVRLILELIFEVAALIIVARAGGAAGQALPPPWYGATIGYVLLPSVALFGISALVGTAFASHEALAFSPTYLRQWQWAIEFVEYLALMMPTCLAVARASGDRSMSLGTLISDARPPFGTWAIAAIVVTGTLFALSSEGHGLINSQGGMGDNQIALRYVLNAGLGGFVTLVRITVVTALYWAAAGRPVRLGEWFA